MAFQDQESRGSIEKHSKRRNPRGRVSFSAKLPTDASVDFRDCVCAVKCTTRPVREIRESIAEVIESVGVRDWGQVEELVYCYVALNSTEIRGLVEDAFLSLCASSKSRCS